MVTAILLLLIVAAVVALAIARPTGPSFSFSAHGDFDRERELAELRTLANSRSEPSRH